MRGRRGVGGGGFQGNRSLRVQALKKEPEAHTAPVAICPAWSLHGFSWSFLCIHAYLNTTCPVPLSNCIVLSWSNVLVLKGKPSVLLLSSVTSANMDSKKLAPRSLGLEASCQGPILQDAEAEGLEKNKCSHSHKSRTRSNFKHQCPSRRLCLKPGSSGLQGRAMLRLPA